ncbi:MAG: DUF2267 domain-containing protein [Acidimicrobiia bacterium]
MVRRTVVRVGGLAVGVAGVVLATSRSSLPGRVVGQAGAEVQRRVRHVRGRMRGVRYQFRGGHPDEHVSDDILADRIRSELGPLEKRLDVPRVHVMVEDRVALLHGEVPTIEDADTIAEAVLDVSGVMAVESYLHVGLAKGDTRPSEGHQAEASPALRRLLDAAVAGGAAERSSLAAVRSVLSAFADRLPGNQVDHLLSHLPADVVALAGPPRRRGRSASRVRTVPELVASATARGGVDPGHATVIAESIIGALRSLVPEEARDVRAVLPKELKEFWDTAVPS